MSGFPLQLQQQQQQHQQRQHSSPLHHSSPPGHSSPHFQSQQQQLNPIHSEIQALSHSPSHSPSHSQSHYSQQQIPPFNQFLPNATVANLFPAQASSPQQFPATASASVNPLPLPFVTAYPPVWHHLLESVDLGDFSSNKHELPLARIKKIMKADKDVRMISAEAPILFSKACELFILDLTMRANLKTAERKGKTLQRQDVAAAIAESELFDFLTEIVPLGLGDEEADSPRSAAARLKTPASSSTAHNPSSRNPLGSTANSMNQRASFANENPNESQFSSSVYQTDSNPLEQIQLMNTIPLQLESQSSGDGNHEINSKNDNSSFLQ